MTVAAPFGSNPDQGLGCSACRPEDSDRRQSLIVELGHKERFFGSNFLPHLSDADLLVYNRHIMRLVRTAASVNRLPRPVFQASLENLFALDYI